MKNMRERWFDFCQKIGVEADMAIVSRAYIELERHYDGEPFRFYHTFEHIERCLNQLDAVRQLCDNPDAVEMALWFHDVFYDVKRADNESRSAMLASYFTGRMGKELDFAVHVINCILATTHKEMPGDLDAQFVVDIDLSSLGAPWEIFKNDTQKISLEYCGGLNISQNEFNAGRAKFIAGMLDKNKRPYIYSTDYFRKKYEKQALKNLRRSLKELMAGA